MSHLISSKITGSIILVGVRGEANGGGSAYNIQITNNDIGPVVGNDAMQIIGDTHNILIENNYLHDMIPTNTEAHPDFIQFFQDFDKGLTPHDVIIRGNVLYDDPSTGVKGSQGISISDGGPTGYHNILVEQNLIAATMPNALMIQSGLENVVLRDNTITEGRIWVINNQHMGNAGVTVENNVAPALVNDGGGAIVAHNYIDSNVNSLLQGYAGGSSWQQFLPKAGSAIDFGTNYGAQDRLQEFLGVATSPGNDRPDAVGDSVNTTEDTALTINAADLLGNDTDPNGDTLSVSGVTNGAHGTATLNGNGTITYTPNANYSGADSFSYTVSDGHGGADTATVAVTVAAVNDAPVAHDDGAVTHSPVTIDVLANDVDPDGDTLIVTSASATKGSVVINSDYTVTYTPGATFDGKDTVTYTISDGHGGVSTAAVAIAGAPSNGGSSPSSEQEISVSVSGDQYNGNPQFRLVVDGQQVGDVQSVSAVHSNGEWQTFKFTVDAPAGFDQVQVQFLNDAYGGVGMDRNLYVASVQINGSDVALSDAVYDRTGKSDIVGQMHDGLGGVAGVRHVAPQRPLRQHRRAGGQ